jgi:diguanylate cyclase (GGDEF)-like protein
VFKRSFKGKIIFPSVMTMFTLLAALSYYTSVRVTSFSDSLVDDKLHANSNSLKLFLDTGMSNTKAAAVSMALNPEAIRAVKSRNRDEINRVFSPTLSLYKISFFTITDEKGIVLLRTSELNSYGDSILDQQSIKNALEGKVSSYFEEGIAIKVSARTGAPLYDTNGKIIGAISAGLRLDNEIALNNIKVLLNSEVVAFSGNTRIASTISEKEGMGAVGTTLDPAIAKAVLEEKKEYYDDIHLFGIKYKALYKPLLNAKGEAFATLALAIPLTKIVEEANTIIVDGFIIGIIALAVSIMTLYFIISSISRPVIVLSKDMHSVANGNLGVEIDVNLEDEVGHLGNAIKKVVNIIRKLIVDINVMIIEQKKGNTEHTMNTDDFQGDYRILANNILELADLGMRDQLTGIPNRRSFDNRLELEWNHAVREKTTLGILMIDVDKFKNYNDTFGHQQGDLALKAVANTLRHSIKRSIDLAARWGGEEFIVLLPDVDINGAMRVAESIRAGIASVEIPCSDPRAAHVTISIGANVQVPLKDGKIAELIAKADKALYHAKESGRNRVVLSGTEPT